MKRKFYTLEEFRHVKKEIEAEYVDKIYASKNPQEKVEILFGRSGKTIPNEFFQRRLEERGFLYDPLGDNIEQTLCCFDIYCVELPQDSIYDHADLDWMICRLRKKRDLNTLDWVAAVQAENESKAIEKFVKTNGFFKLPEDYINPYLYSNIYLQGNFAKVAKYAIFAK